MIRITNIKNSDKNLFDENWAIVRVMKSKSGWMKQVTALSPSTNLFFTYRDLVSKGNWNADTFNSIYVPQFIRELKQNAEAQSLLQYLIEQDKLGKKICLFCFCTDETLCHRSIVAGILRGMGGNVVTDTGKEYLQYYGLYR